MTKAAKRILPILASGLLSCGLFCQQGLAQTASIVGNITFAGSINLDTSSAATATMITSWHGLAPGAEPQVESVDGALASFVAPGDGVIFHAPWLFNSGPVADFWSVDGFTFSLIVSSITFQGSGSVAVSATGTISGNGLAPTNAIWNFTSQDPSASSRFSFSAASGVVVPEGNMIVLLTIGALGLGGLRFREANLFKRKAR